MNSAGVTLGQYYPPPTPPSQGVQGIPIAESQMAAACRLSAEVASSIHFSANRLEALLDRLRGGRPQAVRDKGAEVGSPAHLHVIGAAVADQQAGIGRLNEALTELESLLG